MRLLSQYKPVDCGGTVLNNMGECVRDKIAFCSSYKLRLPLKTTRLPVTLLKN